MCMWDGVGRGHDLFIALAAIGMYLRHPCVFVLFHCCPRIACNKK